VICRDALPDLLLAVTALEERFLSDRHSP